MIVGEADSVKFGYTDNGNNAAEIECPAWFFTSTTHECHLVNVPPGILNTIKASVIHNSIQGTWMVFQMVVPPFFTFNASSGINMGFAESGNPMFSINITFIGHLEKIEVEFTNGEKITQGDNA